MERKGWIFARRLVLLSLLVVLGIGKVKPGLSAPPRGLRAAALAAGTTRLVSVASDGTQGNDRSGTATLSADGRFVAFSSLASNLVPDDTNGQTDIFVRDRQMSQTTRISVASDGMQADNYSILPAISADGRYVAFESAASNLVPGDTNDRSDVFVHDRQTGQTTLVSVASDGTPGNHYSRSPAISADGRYVAFDSFASNLVPDDVLGQNDIFVHDQQTGETERVSVATSGAEGNGLSSVPAISADGRYVAFNSSASNLVTSDTNGQMDVFVHDRQTGETTCVSVSSGGVLGNTGSGDVSISADGRYVAFKSYASNLVPGDTNYFCDVDYDGVWDENCPDIFVHDRQTRQTTRVSVASDGTQGDSYSSGPAISTDGRYVLFHSKADNLVPGLTGFYWDVFVHDRQTGQTSIVSAAWDGGQGNGESMSAEVAGVGVYITFNSSASNLVPDDTNDFCDTDHDGVYDDNCSDVFVHDMGIPPVTYSVSGQVTDGSGEPIPGVLISAGGAGSVTTDADGFYTMGGLLAGTYSLMPFKGGYAFSPSSRTVTVPPDATGQDFTGWRQPVLLVHGFQGFGAETWHCSDGVEPLGPGVVHSFGDMAQWFEDLGYGVWIAHWDTGPFYTPPIEVNAQCLKDQIAYVRQTTGQDVVVVAHSMGGLVSRACLSMNDCRNDVASLYTLGSPHAGSNSLFLLKLLIPVAPELVCVWQPALCQLDTERMLLFNQVNPNRDLIDYEFIGGTATPFPQGWLLYLFDGVNDGAVGSQSAVGWLYPTKLNVIPGTAAGRYWTSETHAPSIGYPSYFEASGGTESQAFRCVSWLLGDRPWIDCGPASDLVRNVTQAESALSATTIEVAGHLSSGQTVNHALQVDTGDRSLFHLSWLSGTLSFTLTQPDGQVITPAYAEAHTGVVTYTAGSGDGMMPPFAAYAFTTTLAGPYTVTVRAEDVGNDGTNYLAFAALETERTFSVGADKDLYQVGDTATFSGTLQGPAGAISGAEVRLQLTRMDGVTETLAFADLGDGMYRTTWTIPDVPGYLQATFTAIGDDDGTTFARQVDRLLAIAPHAAQLAGTYTDYPDDGDGDGYDDALVLEVGVTATEAGTFTLSADLVAEGQSIAHAMQHATLGVGLQTVTLRFDGWDIRRSRLDGPYTVTHVYLMDLGTGGIPAQMADDVWATAAYGWRSFGFERLYLPLILHVH